nr:MAG TPA: hypothetical protein [Caudoviricetes sp.]
MKQPTTPSNHPCHGCNTVRNCLNGRYCPKLGRYVEYSKTKPCAPHDSSYEKALSILTHIQS